MWITLPKPPVAEKSVASFTDQREYYTSIYIFYRSILFKSRQVQEFKNYQNTSSTSKATYKTILIILFNLFSICNAFEFQVTQIFR